MLVDLEAKSTCQDGRRAGRILGREGVRATLDWAWGLGIAWIWRGRGGGGAGKRRVGAGSLELGGEGVRNFWVVLLELGLAWCVHVEG